MPGSRLWQRQFVEFRLDPQWRKPVREGTVLRSACRIAARLADVLYGSRQLGTGKMRDFDLSGRVAIVTGGNGGIGLGMADALARAGCAVSIWGRNAEKNAHASKQLAAHGGAVDARICDVSDRQVVEAAFRATLAEFGRVDACFANAGIGGGGRRAFIDRTEDEWRQMFATNLDGVFHAFQVAARHMTERANAGDPFGRLVATSSLASLFGTARNEHYAATKAAINALVRALAVELARHGVTANASSPAGS